MLYVPSVERDGHTPVDQAAWVGNALDFFGSVFGGATAFPKAKGVWRDTERDNALIYDEPVMVHCYVDPDQVQSDRTQKRLGAFCRRLGPHAVFASRQPAGMAHAPAGPDPGRDGRLRPRPALGRTD